MARFYRLLRQRQWQALRADVVTDLAWALSKIFYGLATVAGMAMGAYLFQRGQLTLGTVYLIIHYLGMLNGPLDRIARQLEDLQRVRVAVERVQQLLTTKSTLTEASPASPVPATRALGVQFANVAFCYHADTPVLHDLSFTLAPGEKLGLLGRTGSGKSTIARLLFRLYDPITGQIQLGAPTAGIDLRNVELATLRSHVGMVTQEVQLFGATVRDNLTLFDPTIADDAILTSLEQLGLASWFQTLPHGLDSEIATNGGGLSAGEGQLLALARLFLKDPGLVILDEASSRLDPVTETLLERALDTILAERTAIIIAHRLATVRRADKILILEEGTIKEFGDYQALANNPTSVFAGLLQTGLEEVLV
jgi:ABC-type multidrug transport system fused ATPase/permease subunit